MAAFYNHYNTGYGVTAEEQSDHGLHSLQYCLHRLEDNILVRAIRAITDLDYFGNRQK